MKSANGGMVIRRFTWLLVFLLYATKAVAEPVILDRIVAVVNDDVILESELEERKTLYVNRIRQEGQQPPNPILLEKEVLNLLIYNTLQIQLARINDLLIPEEELDQMLVNVARRNNLNMDEFRQALIRDGFSFERFRQDMRDEMLISRLRQQHVDSRVSVSDPEIDHYLMTLEHQGEVGSEYRIGHILVAYPSASALTEEEQVQTRERAEQVLGRLRAGEDFLQLAVEFSDASSAPKGGDLGWRKQTEIPGLFVEPMSLMEEGQFSELIEDDSGYHVIKLLEVRTQGQVMVKQMQVRHIMMRASDPSGDAEVPIRLQELRTRILAGEDFAALAGEYSQDLTSSLDGGNLGWVGEGRLPPELERRLAALPVGELSEPFKSRTGWHIAEVLGRRDFDNTDELMRAQAREAIFNRKIEDARQGWLDRLRDEAYVEYRLSLAEQGEG